MCALLTDARDCALLLLIPVQLTEKLSTFLLMDGEQQTSHPVIVQTDCHIYHEGTFAIVAEEVTLCKTQCVIAAF